MFKQIIFRRYGALLSAMKIEDEFVRPRKGEKITIMTSELLTGRPSQEIHGMVLDVHLNYVDQVIHIWVS